MNRLHMILLLAMALYVFLRLVQPRRRERSWAAIYLRYLLLAVAAGVVVSPFLWLVCAVFKDKSVLTQYTFLPPPSQWSAQTLNLGNFRELFAGTSTQQGKVYFWEYILNSLFVASASTCVQVFFCSLGGYALAKYRFRGGQAVMAFMLASMMFPGMLLLAPLFQLIYKLGWMDTYWALIVPGAAGAFGIFLFRQAMAGVPDSLIEAARMDGAGEFRIYLDVAMPLVRPVTSALGLVCFLGAWNAFLGPQIFLQTQAKLTLPVALNHYIGIYAQNYGVFLAGTLLAIIPPAILFFALEKEFVSGLTAGAVKG